MLLNAYQSKAKVDRTYITKLHAAMPKLNTKEKNKLSYQKKEKKTNIEKIYTWLTRRGTTLTND
jgi:predicted AAA+ superfamily ATPase